MKMDSRLTAYPYRVRILHCSSIHVRYTGTSVASLKFLLELNKQQHKFFRFGIHINRLEEQKVYLSPSTNRNFRA